MPFEKYKPRDLFSGFYNIAIPYNSENKPWRLYYSKALLRGLF